MATIQDVAKAAGVSVATVSRVLNGSSAVSEKTKEVVLDVIKKLDYQPNLLGRNLRRLKTKMILVLLPNIANPFYSRVVKGIEDISHKNGYNVMLCNTDSDRNREKVYLELLYSRLADGVIFMSPEIGKDELSEIAHKFPVVQCCEYKEGASASYISIDNFNAAYTAVKHLVDCGYQRIGMISADNRFLSTVQREAGYRKALEDSSLKYDAGYIRYGDYGFKSGKTAAEQLLNLEKRPDAIFAISDIMAVAAIKAVREKGLRVPDDVAVMGFDNISFASMCDPMLTTISQPKYFLGCIAMELLLKQIYEGTKETRSVLLEHELIIRDSTAKHSG